MSRESIGMGEAVTAYLRRYGVREPPLLARLREETAAMPEARMQIAPEQGALLALLARLLGARRTIEVGVFTGYSSLWVALALPADGCLVACDVSERYTAVARRYWAEAGVAERVDLRLGPALQTLEAMLAAGKAGRYDLAFIDADKPGYPAYYERCLALLRPGGLVAVDNVLWGGGVADPAQDDADTVALRAFNAHVAADERVDAVMVPVGDGMTLARKR
ncbi:class I SAM-dependent methyltransferase [Inmirania thermothiophila]|uniref:Putative O-methyltransferase YrrM n=1 Tax=Inmirania thermothiophila TaxID=1750597 RepID=A0A3N1Y867_9GAMM|nr:class I SAM-dependent methyltransferase [Inmirania thermothiophila]ROR35014.1 putative O-methyltransferase YrrM [Inmirania thermothiophila]